MMSDSQAILLLGPTASGKTALALRLAIDIWTSVQPNRQKKKWPQFRIISSTLSNRRKVTLLQILHRTAYDLLQKYEIAEKCL